MKRFLTAIFILFATSSFGQLCGGGIFSIEFYVPNGEKLGVIKYELVPITIDQFDSILSAGKLPKESQQQLRGEINSGILIDTTTVDIVTYMKMQKSITLKAAFGGEDMIETLNQNAKRFGLRSLKLADTLMSSTLQFPTMETYYKLFLLRFTSNKGSGYILANFFGGCDQTINLFWNRLSGFRRFNQRFY